MATVRFFDSLPSTNQYCELLDLSQVEEFAVYCARTQTSGIGQRGNRWESEPGKNLTFSIVLHPTFLNVADQYMLTEALALAVSDWVAGQLSRLPSPPNTFVKWPNDIYVGDSKIGGILTSIRVQGGKIVHAVCGIGLNLNQTSFSDDIPNPVSLKQLTGEYHSIEQCLDQLVKAIRLRYRQLDSPICLEQDYLNRLYRRNIPSQFVYRQQEITATIDGVNRFGHLQLTTAEGERLSCELKEIQFVIERAEGDL